MGNIEYNLICKDCGKSYKAFSNTQYCPYCGGNKKTYNKICKDCGYSWQSNNAAQEICPKCGKK